MVDVVVNVPRNKEIQFAVTVIVAKCRPCRPVAQRHAGFFCDIGKSAVVIVVIEPVLAKIRDIDVRPAVVVIVSDGDPKAPSIVGHSCLCSDIGEGAVMIVVEQSCMGRFGCALHCVIRRTVNDIDIEPTIVVIVKKRYAGPDRIQDVFLLRRSHRVMPACQPRLLSDIFEDHGAVFYEPSRSDRTHFRIEHRIEDAGSRRTAVWRRGRSWPLVWSLRDGLRHATKYSCRSENMDNRYNSYRTLHKLSVRPRDIACQCWRSQRTTAA